MLAELGRRLSNRPRRLAETERHTQHLGRAVLGLRERRELARDLSDRMEAVYGELLPGYGPVSASDPGSVFFVIGPEKQLESYELHLQTVESPEVRLHRLYPRDFWLTRESSPD